MPLFVIIGHDVPNSTELRKTHRPAHLARLNELNEQGRLVIGGPTPATHGQSEMTGSVVIAEFDDESAIRAWVSEEPYLLNGVYSHVDIKPFVQALPKPE